MDATQIAGCAAFSAASIACLAAQPRGWQLVSAANAAFAAETLLGLRHALHNVVIAWLGDHYEDRAPLQLLLILAATAAALGILRGQTSSAKQRKRSPRCATLVAISGLLFLIETISLHGVDAIVYRPLGGLLVIGWLWIALGSATTVCAARTRSLERKRLP